MFRRSNKIMHKAKDNLVAKSPEMHSLSPKKIETSKNEVAPLSIKAYKSHGQLKMNHSFETGYAWLQYFA